MGARPSDQWLKPTTLETGDIEIGKVEIKNSTDDTTATVGANGLHVDLRNVASLVTLAASPNQIGSVTIANQQPLVTGLAWIGFATTNQVNQPALVASSAYIGLASVNIGAGAAWIGLATVANTDPLLISGEDQTNDVLKTEQQFSYTTLTSASTVAVKAAAGFVHLFAVGMPSCPTTIFYDNTVPSGTILHRIAAGHPMGSFPLDVKFTTGLSLDAIAGGGGVVPAIMVAWR